jgi:hypothetical protein
LNQYTRAGGFSLVLAIWLLLSGGCAHPNRGSSEWMKTVNSIKPGTTMGKVRSRLGAPDSKKHGETPLRPYPPAGSPQGVLVTLAPDTEYEDWVYRRGDSRFHVFFARTRTEPRTWEVIAVRSEPASAVN